MERLKDCMEELLKFTLSSHIDETLDFDLGISSKFCTNLLQDDPNDAVSPSTSFDFDSDEDSLQGVPLYPLYKRLALALCRSVNCGAFCRTYKKVALMNEECFLEQKEEEWSQLILNKGSSDLVDILKAVEFELHVQEPFFSFIKDGLETVEGRCTISDYNRCGLCLVVYELNFHNYVFFFLGSFHIIFDSVKYCFADQQGIYEWLLESIMDTRRVVSTSRGWELLRDSD
ncbi:hypothetical protein CISIN_1g022692mg [Citrus sinensis]|uniref:Uncharacterized protein n=1 Tax=Citrus sinensis TaxID=2711 RepID=A0A067DU55_CITSI|nr:hypothetical protein CISIN_1g022692mg [Citrus sinensis]